MTEPELYLTHRRGCNRIELYLDEHPLTDSERQGLEEFQRRRQNGEPLQYILGETEFYGFRIKVDERVLIPRPETEILVDLALEECRRFAERSLRILDMGTGSGNLAIALAKKLPQSKIRAIDRSQAALDLALENAKINLVDEQIDFVCADLLEAFHLQGEPLKKFDLIVSNPPYIPTEDIACLSIEVQREPRLALDGGTDGLDFLRRMIKDGGRFLVPGGCLLVECGDGQAGKIREIFQPMSGFQDCRIFKDLNQKDRLVKVRRE